MKCHLIFITCIVVTGQGCDSYHRAGPRNREALSDETASISLELCNRLGETITESVVHWEYPQNFGIVSANGEASISFFRSRFPDTARVSWVGADGQRHEATAPVVRREPLHNATVCCVLMPDKTARFVVVLDEEAADREDRLMKFRLIAGRPTHYSVATRNMTEMALADIRVYFGPFQVNGHTETDAKTGDVGEGWRMVHGLPYAITERARVTWRTPDGVNHQEWVDLKSQLPEDLDGYVITFEISDRVTLQTLRWADRTEWGSSNLKIMAKRHRKND